MLTRYFEVEVARVENICYLKPYVMLAEMTTRFLQFVFILGLRNIRFSKPYVIYEVMTPETLFTT